MIEFNMTNLVITPIAGTIKAGPMFLDILPDENGVLQVAFDDCPFDPDLRPVGDVHQSQHGTLFSGPDIPAFAAEKRLC